MGLRIPCWSLVLGGAAVVGEDEDVAVEDPGEANPVGAAAEADPIATAAPLLPPSVATGGEALSDESTPGEPAKGVATGVPDGSTRTGESGAGASAEGAPEPEADAPDAVGIA